MTAVMRIAELSLGLKAFIWLERTMTPVKEIWPISCDGVTVSLVTLQFDVLD